MEGFDSAKITQTILWENCRFVICILKIHAQVMHDWITTIFKEKPAKAVTLGSIIFVDCWLLYLGYIKMKRYQLNIFSLKLLFHVSYPLTPFDRQFWIFVVSTNGPNWPQQPSSLPGRLQKFVYNQKFKTAGLSVW